MDSPGVVITRSAASSEAVFFAASPAKSAMYPAIFILAGRIWEKELGGILTKTDHWAKGISLCCQTVLMDLRKLQ